MRMTSTSDQEPRTSVLKRGAGSSFKLKSIDLVQFAVTAATLARDISNMSACPPAAAAASVVLLILETVQANQEACARLARRCANVLSDLDAQMAGRWASAPPLLIKNLEKFRETLWNIHKYLALHVDMKWRVRFMKKSSIEDTVAELHALLSDASQSFQLTDDSDNTLIDEGMEDSDEPATHTLPVLSPIDLDKCLSFKDQVESTIHQYSEDGLDDATSQHFRQYRLSDVRTRPLGRVIENFGWWKGAAEADTTAGQFVLMKRYDRDKSQQYKFHQLQNVVTYLAETFKLSPMRTQNFLNASHDLDSHIGVDEGDLMLSLPESSDGHVGVIRNHGVLETLRMLPRTFREENTPDHSEEDSLLQGLFVSTRRLIWTHQTNIWWHNGEYVPPSPDEEECQCHTILPYPPLPDSTWKGFHPQVTTEKLAVWDFGYFPPDQKGVESFVRLGNLIQDELETYPEDESVSAVQYVADVEYPVNLPYSNLPHGVACWTLTLPSNSRATGMVNHTSRASEEDAWRYLLQMGHTLADEFDVPLRDLRISKFNHTAAVMQLKNYMCPPVTSIEHKIDFDVSYFYETARWDDPPTTMYLLTTADREHPPYLSSISTRIPFGRPTPTLTPEWTCTLKWRIGAVQSVAVTHCDDVARVLSSSPTPE
ncbi:hypothetical protein DXG01_000294 [Tephrocybe rancida]|nr:hypothetical protein DXG01_000294 [Tephrocybe rancida]